ncbi:MAG: hypothetical protein GY839_00460 [candidate division Zixibacteria bacterium]|nr:hypothetical protein [candidate division Zixibacteria bacterium]
MNNLNRYHIVTPMNYKTVLFPILYAIAAVVIISMVKSPGLAGERAGIIAMSQFEGHKPFQYRVLIPATVRIIEFLTPAFIENKVNQLAADRVEKITESGLQGLSEDKARRLGLYGYRCVAYIILNWFALFLFLLTLRYLALSVKAFSRLTCDLLPLGMIAVMPIFFDYGNFVYDFSHLFLFTLGLLMMYRERWPAFIIIFVVALLNKETAVMLTVIFVFYFHSKIPRQMFLKLLVMQISIFFIIKLSLYFLFQSNPGGIVEWHLIHNIQQMSRLTYYFQFESIGKGLFSPFYIPIPVPHGLNLPMFVLVIALAVYRWREKPAFLRISTSYFAISLILGFMFGIFCEWRSYYDALPIIYLLSALGVIKLIENYRLNKIGT